MTDVNTLIKNEKLLSTIQTRQKNLHVLSKYLSELESQLALIFASSPDIIVFLDKQARIIKMSDAAFPILGYTRSELIGRCLWDFIIPEDLQQTKKHFESLNSKKVVSYRQKQALVNHWLSKDGEPVKLVWRFSVCDEREQHTIGIASDITEFGANDRYTIKLLQKAVESSTDGIIVIDAEHSDNTIVYANQSFEEITGFSQAETLGQHFCFAQTEESKESRAMNTVRLSIQNGKGCDVLLQGVRKNGDVFYNRLTLSPVVERGIMVNYIGVFKDATCEIGVKYEWSPNTQMGFCELK